MFLGAREMQYRLVGMPVDPGRLAGMGLIVGGLALYAYGSEVYPARLEEITAVELRQALEAR